MHIKHVFKFKTKFNNIKILHNSKSNLFFINTTSFSFCTTPNNSSMRNITPNIEDKLNKKLYLKENHPIHIIKSKITSFFSETNRKKWSKLENLTENKFDIHESLPQIVSTKDCFDNLLVDKDNETRSPKNTYYVDDNSILRTHMTTFDIPLIRSGNNSFICIGDVFRRDAIDNTHYPIFHQVDAVRLFNVEELTKNPYSYNNNVVQIIQQDLQYCLENLIK